MIIKPHEKLLQLVEKKGNTQEKQVVRRWRNEIIGFLEPFTEGLLKGDQRLEIGLEQDLVLKMVIKSKRYVPYPGLIKIAPTLPPRLREACRLIEKNALRFHLGIRLDPTRCHREIYVHNDDRLAEQWLAEETAAPGLPKQGRITGYGIDELHGLSAYYARPDNPFIEALVEPTARRISDELKVDVSDWFTETWRHFRLREGRWHEHKFAVEFAPAPLELVVRIISHYKPPHFRYLIRRSAHESTIISATLKDGSTTWYFTL